MEFFELFLNNSQKNKKNDNVEFTYTEESDEEEFLFPQLRASSIPKTKEIQMRMREEELCKHYGIQLQRKNDMDE